MVGFIFDCGSQITSLHKNDRSWCSFFPLSFMFPLVWQLVQLLWLLESYIGTGADGAEEGRKGHFWFGTC